ncbi:RagB/SusD family nutrient uptake outer membrane protein [Echinicola sp. CAU 1574]|uniref:RagB/SusD family nutrient uptake outer membrane protein n=1 Tax=Echinicola arenosa TaxID=2774144 RepID=A0ABR9AHE6_9BACT|nr:RagB/SusD family nutrient uptake outer membrane protein [Echinicola arenosa]MBD8487370.1 RagB/SusD family nutrient uptake outer membrane protein [Echinicola arenosa]
MKLKNIYWLFILNIGLLSCSEDFIDLAPEDQQSGNSFFQTEEQFYQALAAAYTPFRDLLVNDFFTGEMRSDNTHYEYSDINFGTAYIYRRSIADFNDDEFNSYSNAVYFHAYKGISRANIVLDHLESVSLPEETYNDISGQAKFIRALNYFYLVRYFGNVPLYLHEVTSTDGAFLAQSSQKEVYEQIIQDCTESIAQLSAPSKFPQNGMATKGSATMLLGRVHLRQGNYAEAESLFKSLEAIGYGLLDNYADVFNINSKNSIESLFEIQFREGDQGGQQNGFVYSFLPRTTNTSIVTGVATNNSGTGGWNTPTPEIIAAFEPGDKRKDISIGIAEGTYDASNYFDITANKSIVGYVPEEGKVGVPYIKKYITPHSLPNNTDNNWPIFRYADALLSLAEALNEQGKSIEALSYLNQVRDRAFGENINRVTVSDQTELRDIILHERQVELAFENHRWHDLVRSGKAVSTMNAFGIKQKERFDYLITSTYMVDDHRMLFPIPKSEIDLNPDLIQNPGY